MEFNIISPETNEPEYGEENPQMYDKINNQTNMINENIIEEEMINFKSQNYFLFLENNKENKYCLFSIGDWELGIGDWGLGIGLNPQSPIPNPHCPIPKFI